MASAWLDICRFTPSAGGTTDWTYSSAVTGYQSPTAASVVSGTIYSYRAESADLTQWEIGYGAYSGGVFSRTTVLFNSSGTTSKISFTLTPQVAIVALKEDMLSMAEANSFNTTQQAQGRTNLAAAPFDDPARNALQVNGAMDVSQELVTNSATLPQGSGKYILDQWICLYVQAAATAVFTGQQVTPPGSPAFGVSFPNCLQMKATTHTALAGSTDYNMIYQPIEAYRWARLGFGNSNALSVTIGFWIYATISGTGTLSLRNSAANRCYIANFTVTSGVTWQYITLTIPGDTSGTWTTGNGIGTYMSFCFGSGSTNQGTNASWQAGNLFASSSTTNFFSSDNNLVCLTGIGVWPGGEAPVTSRSPIAFLPLPATLDECQRYFRKSFPQGTAVAQNAGVTGAVCIKNPIALGDPSEMVYFNPPMRTTPTITTYNPSGANANWRDVTASSDVTVSVDPATAVGDSGVLLATSGTVATLGDILAIHYTANARM
jgi:hypothetical protein